MDSVSLTPCESEVMHVVWQHGAVTVQEVVDGIARPLAYTTVMTTLKILEEKGIVERTAKRGRAYLYSPLVSRKSVRRSMVAELANRLFGGSLKSMVLSLAQTNDITMEDIQELRSAIEALEDREE